MALLSCMQTFETGISHQANGNARRCACLSDLAKSRHKRRAHQGFRRENSAGMAQSHRLVIVSSAKDWHRNGFRAWFQLWSSNIVGATFCAWRYVVHQQQNAHSSGVNIGVDVVVPRPRINSDFAVAPVCQPSTEPVRCIQLLSTAGELVK